MSLTSEVSTLEGSSFSLKSVVSDLAASAVRIAGDVVKYAVRTKKYISAMQSGGRVSMKKILS